MPIIANLHRRRNGASIGLVISSFMLLLGWASSGSREAVAHGQSVLTQHNDNQRTGAQLQETQLTPATVAQSFGCLYTLNISSPASASFGLLPPSKTTSGLSVTRLIHSLPSGSRPISPTALSV